MHVIWQETVQNEVSIIRMTFSTTYCFCAHLLSDPSSCIAPHPLSEPTPIAQTRLADGGTELVFLPANARTVISTVATSAGAATGADAGGADATLGAPVVLRAHAFIFAPNVDVSNYRPPGRFTTAVSADAGAATGGISGSSGKSTPEVSSSSSSSSSSSPPSSGIEPTRHATYAYDRLQRAGQLIDVQFSAAQTDAVCLVFFPALFELAPQGADGQGMEYEI
jgi:hypothetical protein